MIDDLARALGGADLALARIDEIIAGAGRRAQDDRRLLALLRGVVVGRTMNMGFLGYARLVCAHWDALAPGEPEAMAQEIRKTMRAVVEIIGTFGDDGGLDVFDDEAPLGAIADIARGDDRLVQQIKAAREARDPAALDAVLQKYEAFCVAARARAAVLGKADAPSLGKVG